MGYNTELFAANIISERSRREFRKMSKGLKGNERIPAVELFGTFGYYENQAWAKKIVDNGYTAIDIGDPNRLGFSVYYTSEKRMIFTGSEKNSIIKFYDNRYLDAIHIK